MQRVAAVLFASVLSWQAAAEPVRIDAGLVEGVTLASGVRAWLGIPQAAPPLRELRWRAPQPVPRVERCPARRRQAPMCLQPVRTRTMNHYFGNEATSEDCLYLNVWAPSGAEQLPVIVWIYGGGFNVGSASMANYSGEKLAADGVVRVNLSYRLGALGFLAHPELTRESGYGGSGNYGLMDLVAGLQWVQRNIAAFGGDPANVTIVGQSAGSMAVALLQASPPARGLFTKVVGMSGSPFGEPMRAVTLEQGEHAGLALQEALAASSIEDLRDIGGDRIVAAPVAREPIVARRALRHRRRNRRSSRSSTATCRSWLGSRATSRSARSARSRRSASSRAPCGRVFPRTAPAVLAAYRAHDAASAAARGGRHRPRFVGRRADGELGAGAGEAQPLAGVRVLLHAAATVRTGHHVHRSRSGDSRGVSLGRDSLFLAHARLAESVPPNEDLGGRRRARSRRTWPRCSSRSRATASRSRRACRRGRHSTPSGRGVVSLGVEIEIVDWPNYAALPLLAAPVDVAGAGAGAPARTRLSEAVSRASAASKLLVAVLASAGTAAEAPERVPAGGRAGRGASGLRPVSCDHGRHERAQIRSRVGQHRRRDDHARRSRADADYDAIVDYLARNFSAP